MHRSRTSTTGGCGGSGCGLAEVTFETGVQSGDGVVSISPDPAAECTLTPGPGVVPAPEPLRASPRFTG